MSISNLSAVSKVSGSDALAGASQGTGADVRIPMSALVDYLQQALDAPGDMASQLVAPTASGFSVLVMAAGDGLGQDVWLLLTPTGAFAAGTVTLPAVSLCQDGQELLVTTTQAVTALTVAGNGASVNGAPTTLAANAAFRLKFYQVNQSWYRIS